MNKTHGRSGYGFSVFQQGNESSADWSILTITKVRASVAAGVDKEFPTRSYMFHREPAYSSGRVFLSTPGQKGSSIPVSLENTINDIIISV